MEAGNRASRGIRDSSSMGGCSMVGSRDIRDNLKEICKSRSRSRSRASVVGFVLLCKWVARDFWMAIWRRRSFLF